MKGLVMIFPCLSLPFKPAELHCADMKGKVHWWESILDTKMKSASAALSRKCGGTVYYNALLEPDESQQDPSQLVNHNTAKYS